MNSGFLGVRLAVSGYKTQLVMGRVALCQIIEETVAGPGWAL